MSWENTHVCQWAKEKANLQAEDIGNLQKSKLTGDSLLLLTDLTVMKDLIGLSESGAFRLFESVQKLKDEIGNPILHILSFKKIESDFHFSIFVFSLSLILL
jgi:hypothetical protein